MNSYFETPKRPRLRNKLGRFIKMPPRPQTHFEKQVLVALRDCPWGRLLKGGGFK